MKQRSWQGMRVLIIGAARQGLALARFLAAHGAHVILNDQRSEHELEGALQGMSGIRVEWVLGAHPLTLLDRVGLVCLSGGVPLDNALVVEASRRGIELANDTQIFMELVPCLVIGITGSAGKTTTTTLVGRMAEAAVAAGCAYRKAWVGGNIGNPLINEVTDMAPDDLVVMELSSFQLEQMTLSPHIGAVLNVTPNHLDRHGDMQTYTAAKARLLAFQTSSDIAVLNREDHGAWELAAGVKGRLVTFGINPPPADQDGAFCQGGMIYMQQAGRQIALLPQDTVNVRGQHNLLNVLAACAIAWSARLSPESMQAGLVGFQGVPHRLEFVRTWGGADWYNDSIATTPERAIADIQSFDEPLVLLAGGRDKKLPWHDYAALVQQRVDHLVVFGEAAEKILAAVGTPVPGKRPYSITQCAGLQEAIEQAALKIKPGDVVLLAPGGTSFDQFRDFEERGECYRLWVKELS